MVDPGYQIIETGLVLAGMGLMDRAKCLQRVTSDKTHIEHNETALDLIADMPGDMDFCCNGPIAEVGVRAKASIANPLGLT